MAIFSPGAVIASIHGSIGGITFRRTRAAAVLSLKSCPCYKHSFALQQRHVLFETAKLIWAYSHSPSNRLAWRNAARLLNASPTRKGTSTISGRSLYFRFALRDQPGYGVPGFPGSGRLLRPATNVTTNFTSGLAYYVNLSAWPPPYNIHFRWTLAAPLPLPFYSCFESVGAGDDSYHHGQTFDIRTDWLQHNPEILPGQFFDLTIRVEPTLDESPSLLRVYGTAHA